LSELERDAHRMVLDRFEDGNAVDDPELIASRVLFAHNDVTASMHEEYLEEALTDLVR
jgi:hypothetical protein